jgi:hypothetical protein
MYYRVAEKLPFFIPDFSTIVSRTKLAITRTRLHHRTPSRVPILFNPDWDIAFAPSKSKQLNKTRSTRRRNGASILLSDYGYFLI